MKISFRRESENICSNFSQRSLTLALFADILAIDALIMRFARAGRFHWHRSLKSIFLEAIKTERLMNPVGRHSCEKAFKNIFIS